VPYIRKTQTSKMVAASKSELDPSIDGLESSRTIKVLLLSISGILSLLVNIAFGMVAARHLNKHDYATIKQTFLAFEVAVPILTFGLPNAILYFLPREQMNRCGLLIDNLALLVLGGISFSIFVLLGGDVWLARRFSNMDLAKTLPWMAIYSLFVLPTSSLGTVLVFSHRVRTLALYTTLTNLVLAIGGILSVYLTRSYVVPILVRLLIAGFQLPIAIYFQLKAVPGFWRMPSFKSMNHMVRYSFPLGLATMLGTITIQLHSILVAALCNSVDFSVYVNGAIEVPIIGVVTGSITSVIFADMSDACSKGDKQFALKLFQKASVQSACFLFPTMCFFVVMAEPFIVFLYSDEYRDSVIPFLIYLAILPARIIVYGAAMMALGLTREILFRSIIDLVLNGLLCWILVRYLGYKGAALGLVITLYGWTIPFNIYKLAVGFRVKWVRILPWAKLTQIMLLSIAVGFSLLLFRKKLGSISVAADLIISAIWYTILICPFLYKLGHLSFINRYIKSTAN
jgi:O-antigen/teichoic acid export membrane protein